MKLSNNQIEIIRAQVARSIQLQSLQDDVVDHVCCSLEDLEDLKGEFEEAVQNAVDDLAPAGLHQLERDTMLLLNTKYIVMKKMMFLLGLVSAIGSSLGICFKLMHFPGAEFLLTYGLLTLTLVYLPLQAVVWFKSFAQRDLLKKLEVLIILLSGLLTGAAIVMRLLHVSRVPVDLTFMGSMAIFCFGFLPIMFFNQYKKSIA
jgi:hypothetical protein